jgi:thiol-disulfide isomerase/thioredoxin
MNPGLIALCAALACALAGGAVWRARNGRMRAVTVRGQSATAQTGPPAEALTSADLGAGLGERATLIQFSSAFCAPCRATRRILTDVAGMTDGVEYVEIDAESRLDLVRAFNVLRTPTVLVTDAAGRVVKRASGQPRKADVIAALGIAIPANPIDKEDSDIRVRPA